MEEFVEVLKTVEVRFRHLQEQLEMQGKVLMSHTDSLASMGKTMEHMNDNLSNLGTRFLERIDDIRDGLENTGKPIIRTFMFCFIGLLTVLSIAVVIAIASIAHMEFGAKTPYGEMNISNGGR